MHYIILSNTLRKKMCATLSCITWNKCILMDDTLFIRKFKYYIFHLSWLLIIVINRFPAQLYNLTFEIFIFRNFEASQGISIWNLHTLICTKSMANKKIFNSIIIYSKICYIGLSMKRDRNKYNHRVIDTINEKIDYFWFAF